MILTVGVTMNLLKRAKRRIENAVIPVGINVRIPWKYTLLLFLVLVMNASLDTILFQQNLKMIMKVQHF
jgi:hypothetical protein